MQRSRSSDVPSVVIHALGQSYTSSLAMAVSLHAHIGLSLEVAGSPKCAQGEFGIMRLAGVCLCSAHEPVEIAIQHGK